MICISHGFPGDMEFSPTSSPYPAQSRVAARAGFGDEWENPTLLENHVKCIFSHATLCCQNVANNNMRGQDLVTSGRKPISWKTM